MSSVLSEHTETCIFIFYFVLSTIFHHCVETHNKKSSLQNTLINDGYPYIQDTLFYRYISTFFHWNVVLTH